MAPLMAARCAAASSRGGLSTPLPTLLLAAAALLRGAAAQEDTSSMLGYDPPLCGFSKRTLIEDPIRRFCLRQCRVEHNKRMRPTFDEFEEYCRETASMKGWDPDCRRYLGCTYGCEIWGEDREALLSLSPEERPDFLLETHANMYAAGITKETRCILEKCHAFCARTSFDSCREMQFQQRCTDSNPLQGYGCDVDCSGAWRGLSFPYALATIVVASVAWVSTSL
jgi:hypothetical protein